ncbi:probable vacuolar amino acid transporter YPQ1 isoform X3 [Eucalyptus grandis]|uniref:probable vacuolar amino acid transporter YPQ1 isoform X3 n=1 Tax=Eucalyptus grandis TaxID=71139 RepID=UPI00192EEFE1|nr:probable vacuolar amino acid transporter YPQ1 isoform X3 [Eucalyptus grandis]
MSSIAYCAREKKPCVRWVEKYFKDCLCNARDEASFGFGMISLVCWGVAEIPQIITNFRTKSSHGVSLAFLLTWVAGDVFNLVGCLLEPATLYTASTVVLVLQSLYYDHVYSLWKGRHIKKPDPQAEEKEPLKPKATHQIGIAIPGAAAKATPVKASPRKEFFYTSARSLAGSGTPPFRTYIRVAKSGPSTVHLDSDSSSDDEAARVPSTKSVSKPKQIPRSVGYGTFLASSLTLPLQNKSFTEAHVVLSTRKLLQQEGGIEHSVFGQWLGWLMAAIYMGGRIPQIWLNIKRGSVEGLNPLMFIFALVANVTYVGSILVRTVEWESIEANMPWLLDAIVCVALDLFIILQYIYYRYFRRSENSDKEGLGHYEEAGKGAGS